MSRTSPRRLALLALLALVPIAAYTVDREAPFVALTTVCVALIVVSLHLMFGPAEPA